jgi:hypothetical protein
MLHEHPLSDIERELTGNLGWDTPRKGILMARLGEHGLKTLTKRQGQKQKAGDVCYR